MYELTIPASSSVVDVFIIDNGCRTGGFPAHLVLDPVLPGYEDLGKAPSYSFLIRHYATGRYLLFDLGVRKNWETAYPPAFKKALNDLGMTIQAGEDTADVLGSNGVSLNNVDSIVFSHHHFDHTGDTSKFPKSTSIVVGPGYKETYLPGWPANGKQIETTSDIYEGRVVTELVFDQNDPKVSALGGFQAYDFFGDQSLYFLSTPGHTTGHLSALARTTSVEGQSTFMFLGGDIVHTSAVFRPTAKYPLPQSLPHPLHKPYSGHTCPGDIFAKIHRHYNGTDGGRMARTTPFCKVTGPEDDLAEAQRSADKLSGFDGEGSIFTIWAHDASLLDVIEFFPQQANEWKAKGWKKDGHWRWLGRCILADSEAKL